VVSPQLLPRRLRHRPQLAAGAAEGHGDARIERVAQFLGPLWLKAQCTTYRNAENPGGSAPWTPALPGASRCAGPSVLGMGLPAAKGQLSPDLAAAVIWPN